MDVSPTVAAGRFRPLPLSYSQKRGNDVSWVTNAHNPLALRKNGSRFRQYLNEIWILQNQGGLTCFGTRKVLNVPVCKRPEKVSQVVFGTIVEARLAQRLQRTLVSGQNIRKICDSGRTGAPSALANNVCNKVVPDRWAPAIRTSFMTNQNGWRSAPSRLVLRDRAACLYSVSPHIGSAISAKMCRYSTTSRGQIDADRTR